MNLPPFTLKTLSLLATIALASTPISLATDFSSASERLDPQTQAALIEAIQDEYRARALYSLVIQKFGPIRPFSNIIQAESRHVKLWEPLFIRYGIPVPKDTFAGKAVAPVSVASSCQSGVIAEKENVALYERFLGFVKEPDLRSTFSLLQQVSQEKHLPAFQRCAGS